MNWKTKEILKEAKQSIDDDGVFSPDQIEKLSHLIDLIAQAIDKESEVNKQSVNYQL